MVFHEQPYLELVDLYGPIMLEGGTVALIKQSPDCLPVKGLSGTKLGLPSKTLHPYVAPYRLSHCHSPCPPSCVSPCGPIYSRPSCITPYRPICIPQCAPPCHSFYPYPCQPQGMSSCIPIYGRPQCLTPYRPICVNPCQSPCYPPCAYPRPQVCVRPNYLYPQRPCYPYYGYPCASQCGQLSPCSSLGYPCLF